ncbi:PREDICTED: zona pellucida sperm-binding protein 3 [Chrysochloris asiatica]|uniref:Zona pellucida sperm-binding protein 3 n=1 Tax=Chrysochloris asiatica TaxID=185453 RepID=A0A9B0WLA9_CHRAS|nr:PREDICTED: zona pellucida sperm-binding protein 3 [Chrysochloris asiatica]
MELSYGLFICFLLWGSTELCCPHPLWFLQGGAHGPVSSLPSVLVECLEAQLVVTVNRNLFGTGKLVRSSDLTLGPEQCEPLASEDTADVVRFEVGLHECGNRVQVTDDALVYSTFLLHKPRPVANQSILRTNRAEVPIECHYPRQVNVSSWAVLPTWVPFRTTVLFEEKLPFSLRLMEEDWSTEKRTPTFQLGDTAHLQAEVHVGNHMPLRLFVDHCVATPTPGRTASTHHTIVDFHGCLVDGLSDTASGFRAPRPGSDTLQFTVDVFHFANDSRNTIYITCHLKVTPANQAPDQLNKACSFSKSSNSWSPVEGTSDICGCCNKGDCGMPGLIKRLPPVDQLSANQWQKSTSRKRRNVAEEADVTVGPLILLDKSDYSMDRWPSAAHSSMTLGLGLVTAVTLTLAAIVLGLAKRRHAVSYPVMDPVSSSQ